MNKTTGIDKGLIREIGHLCVEKNVRPCGDVKNGRLEKYCAGGGLDITASAFLGNCKNASDLFDEAKTETKKHKKRKRLTQHIFTRRFHYALLPLCRKESVNVFL